MSLRFCHLHCHTDYSLLDGAAKIVPLIQQAKKLGMDSLAITDHGNMFGVPQFVIAAAKQGIKPIIGCEFYVTPTKLDERSDKRRYHQILLAKNRQGYNNLMKLCSIGYTRGYYYKPRIDKQVIRQHAEGLIATTCCLGAEVPRVLLEEGEEAARQVFLQWRSIFKEDYYIELQRHGIPEQDRCNEVLKRWSKEYGVKMLATNDVHYIHQEDSVAQDIMLCLQTGKDYADPNRMRFPTNAFYLKSPQEMLACFSDIPEAIEQTVILADQIESIDIQQPLRFPKFPLPADQKSQKAYLLQLALKQAEQIHGKILPPQVYQRIEDELNVIDSMGFCGYFLIVQDLVQAARKLGVWVGPGRGSVAGSAMAYYLGITTIDPLKYNLIFERFLNKDRISMPDIDLDFDDQGREKVINYLVEKYGYNQVAQIITFGTMGAKSAIRDVGRVLNMPLQQANQLAKWVPEKPGTSLTAARQQTPELEQAYKKGDQLTQRVLQLATTLEGSTRHAGIHAAGIIIAPDDLINYIPLKKDKRSNLLITQYEGAVVEHVGMLKMDILGLKTLSILRDSLHIIKETQQKKIDLATISLEDKKSYQLFQKGETIGVFQFESPGMQKYLKQLKPTTFEDLIAMNALYRPGPMQFIPNFIARKQGKERISYPHPLLEPILKNSFGIIVYQEQVMQVAQIIAGYTLAQADILRRAMGKKKVEEMVQQKSLFCQGAAKKHRLSKEKSEEIFSLMEKFAQYGFPRAHATAYARIAYETAYLKANFPAAYMAAILIHNQNDISKITFFIKECWRLNIPVLGPDINESEVDFTSSKTGNIRFGFKAIKGVGEGVAELIVKERKRAGRFSSFENFCERIHGQRIHKKLIENLALAGSFDQISCYHRKQYVAATEKKDRTFIEELLAYLEKKERAETALSHSLFAKLAIPFQEKAPTPPVVEPYTQPALLAIERELVGFYLSGHPLADFSFTLKHYCNTTTAMLRAGGNLPKVLLGAMLTGYQKKQSKNGNSYGSCTIEDLEGSYSFMLFGSQFRKFEHMLHIGELIYLVGKLRGRRDDSDRYEFVLEEIKLLSEVFEEKSKSLQIQIHLPIFGEEQATQLKQLLKKNKGKKRLSFNFQEESTQIESYLFCRREGIDISKELLIALVNIPGISYKLNL